MSCVLVDTNVLVDVLVDDPNWSSWSIGQLTAQSKVHDLVINPVIYAELSTTFSSLEAFEEVLSQMQLRFLPLPKPALFLAGKAFVQYRRRGGTKTSLQPDFMIGAHAATGVMPILTRDGRMYERYFPTVSVIQPTPH